MYSFARKKKKLDVRSLARRLADTTIPSLVAAGDELRFDGRLPRSLPVVVAPWEDDRACAVEATTALTKNISSKGVALLLRWPLRTERAVIGFQLAGQAHFVVGEVRQNTPLGGGFWQLGIEFGYLLDPAESPTVAELLPLAASLTAR